MIDETPPRHPEDSRDSEDPRNPRETKTTLPPDPARYDEYRSVAARRRGLDQPYIAGGDDPELRRTLERERPYVRLLLVMVAFTVLLGFILGIIGAVITGPAA